MSSKPKGGDVLKSIFQSMESHSQMRTQARAAVPVTPVVHVKPKIQSKSVRQELMKYKHGIQSVINEMRSKNDEVEASFGKFHRQGKKSHFNSGFMSSFRFQMLKNYFDARVVEKGGTFFPEEVLYEMEIDNHGVRRKEISGDFHYQKKIRQYKTAVDVAAYGIRIVKSFEQPISDGPDDFIVVTKRLIHRFSYAPSTKEEFFGFRIDLSDIIETNVEKKYTFHKYEVEIEMTTKSSVESFINVMDSVFRISIGISPDDTIDYVPDSLDMRTGGELFNTVLGLDEGRFSYSSKIPHSEHADFLRKQAGILTDAPIEPPEKTKLSSGKHFNPDNLISLFWSKPITMQFKHLFKPSNFQATLKYDGERSFLFLHNFKVYLCMPPYTIIQVGTTDNKITALLDGELMTISNHQKVTYKFWCFDVIHFNGDIRKDFFSKRFSHAQTCINMCKVYPSFELGVKSYVTVANVEKTSDHFYKVASLALDEYEKAESLQNIDGIIFQSENTYYSETLKWKPSDRMTIEFLFKIEDDLENYTYTLYVSSGNKTVPFLIDGEQVQVITKTNMYDNKIVECLWNESRERFVPQRIRHDRQKPNNVEIAQSNWKIIKSPIDMDTLRGESLVVMRKMHNNTKNKFLSERNGADLIDIGSGRGGDLNKWGKYMKTVFALEPNEDNMQIFEQRLEKVMDNVKKHGTTFGAKIIPVNAGAEKTSKILSELKESGLQKVPLITAFFSLMYFPENDDMYSGLIDTIEQTLADDGEFIGIIMDGDKVREALKSGNISNDVFQIKKKGDFTEEPFGNAIKVAITEENSMVKGHTEYLFDFNHFRSKLANIGLYLKSSGFLESEEYKALPKLSAKFNNLFRTFVFKKSGKSSIYTLKNGDTSLLKIATPNLYYTGVIQNNESIIHCILEIFSETYQSSNSTKRQKQAQTLRSKLSAFATPEFAVANPEIFGTLTDPQKGARKLLEYKLSLLDFDNPLSQDCVALIEFILEINIAVLTHTYTKDENVYKFTHLSSLHKQSVIIATSDGIHYQPVFQKKGAKTTYIFGNVNSIQL
ncbi:MAG TPA: hypothetical protein VLE02_00865 [Nitrosarchaeum sp.]|nr:hypothetical protein [Nitrosarchaeum sp.]